MPTRQGGTARGGDRVVGVGAVGADGRVVRVGAVVVAAGGVHRVHVGEDGVVHEQGRVGGGNGLKTQAV